MNRTMLNTQQSNAQVSRECDDGRRGEACALEQLTADAIPNKDDLVDRNAGWADQNAQYPTQCDTARVRINGVVVRDESCQRAD